ncbi:MAG: glycosyltransferase [Candidatus Limiplasma sp.]|nr:glycosyltransferase [Candidatus Limiplasma sp.]
MAEAKRQTRDVLLQETQDRRLLPHVPDSSGQRRNRDRRDHLFADKNRPQHATYAGRRFLADIPVRMSVHGKRRIRAHSVDVSQTGIQLNIPPGMPKDYLAVGDVCNMDFTLQPGIMQEGTESRYRVRGSIVRWSPERGTFAVRFAKPLYVSRRAARDVMLSSLSLMFLFLVTLVILLMRTESVLYFSQNSLLYGYSIATAAFLLTRYLFGALYKPVPINYHYTPSITIVIPCYNEETWIARTILSCLDQDYPPEKLQIIIVDDGSSDGSVEAIKYIVRKLWLEDERFDTKRRIRVFFQKRNQGKREAMALGIRNTNTELIGFVDSDSFLEPDAIRHLVQPMIDPKMGGVTGRTDVVNTYTNRLTKMQSVRYYISFRIIKAAEAYFGAVTCLSGPLSCYRLSAVQKVLDPWLNQTFLGRKATFGDDRSLTNFVVRNHRTSYQDTAICSTLVPISHKVFLRQQMRWKRSWLRESLKAGAFMWRKEPLMSLSFYMGLLIPLIAPIIMVYNLIYVPLTMRIFPTTFLLGILMMSLLMSFAQLRLKKSTLWVYGLWFVLYYEAVLLWQMPYAWITFWVSDWGTRGTKRKKKKTGAGVA